VQVRYGAADVIKETEALSLKTQAANTKCLAERLHDVNYWKSELQRQITDMISETDLLCQQKLRLENALRATEIPLHIATDNLHCRQRRQGIDLVQDDIEINLLKVCSVAFLRGGAVVKLLRRTCWMTKFKKNWNPKNEITIVGEYKTNDNEFVNIAKSFYYQKTTTATC